MTLSLPKITFQYLKTFFSTHKKKSTCGPACFKSLEYVYKEYKILLELKTILSSVKPLRNSLIMRSEK